MKYVLLPMLLFASFFNLHLITKHERAVNIHNQMVLEQYEECMGKAAKGLIFPSTCKEIKASVQR